MNETKLVLLSLTAVSLFEFQFILNQLQKLCQAAVTRSCKASIPKFRLFKVIQIYPSLLLSYFSIGELDELFKETSDDSQNDREVRTGELIILTIGSVGINKMELIEWPQRLGPLANY